MRIMHATERSPNIILKPVSYYMLEIEDYELEIRNFDKSENYNFNLFLVGFNFNLYYL